MQNSFEKQVQEKMESLQFTPTPPVWQNIQKQIHPKKDRRRLLLWLPVLILILGSGWWWLNVTNLNAGGAASQKVHKAQTKDQPFGISRNNFQSERQKTIVTNAMPGEVRAGVDLTRSNNKEIKDRKTQNAEAIDKVATAVQVLFPIDETEIKTKSGNTVSVEHVRLQDKSNESGDSSSLNTGIADVQKVVTRDTSSELKIQAPVAESLVVKKNTGRKHQNDVTIGLTAQAGVSGISNGFRVFSDQRSLDYLATPSPGSSGQFFNAPAKPPQKGKMFAFGIAASKRISRRFAISAGIQYRLYSTQIFVGEQHWQDTMISNNRVVESFFANTGRQSEYQNRFHFIAVPVLLQWQLLKSAPLKLDAGISLQGLVGTNALLYDAGGNVFYRDKEVFAKIQVLSELGLTYAFWQGKNTSLHIGPQMQYALSGLMKDTERKHLYSLGISAQVNFKSGAKL